MKYILEASAGTDGSGLGIACSDDISGALVCGCGIVQTENGTVRLNVNARCPVTAEGHELLAKLQKHAEDKGFHLEKHVCWNQITIRKRKLSFKNSAGRFRQ